MPEVETSAAPSSSFEAEIAEIWGDMPMGGAQEPAPDKSATSEPAPDKAGAPVPDAAAAKETAAAPTPEKVVEAAPTTPAPDETANALKDYTPLSVEGRPIEGIHVRDGYGAIVDADHLPDLVNRLTRAAQLETALEQTAREKDTFEKGSTWNVLKQDGSIDKTLTGLPAVEAMRVAFAQSRAALDTLVNVLKDPNALLSLLSQDEKGAVQINPQEIQNLLTRSQLAEIRAEQAVRSHFASVSAPQPQSYAFNPAEAGPRVVAATLGQLGVKNLSADSQQFLAGMVPRFIHAATAADVKQNLSLKLGEPVLEPEWQSFVKQHTDAMQARAQSTDANRRIAAENAARLEAAKTGATPAKQPKPVDRTAPKVSQSAKDKDQLFNMMQAGTRGVFAAAPEE